MCSTSRRLAVFDRRKEAASLSAQVVNCRSGRGRLLISSEESPLRPVSFDGGGFKDLPQRRELVVAAFALPWRSGRGERRAWCPRRSVLEWGRFCPLG